MPNELRLRTNCGGSATVSISEKRKKAGRASTRRASGLKVNPDFSPIRFDLWTHCILHQVTI
ncbi:MAG: hypothetical protein ACR2OA_06755, partial [Rubripirellula sp.]